MKKIKKMETTMNQSYQITVNDSALSTKRWGLHAALLFIGCYALEFLAYCLIDHIFGIYNYYVEEYMPEGAFVIALLIVCVYYALREKRTKGVMQLKLQFDSDAIRLNVNRRQHVVRYHDITEVRKIMVIDRTHTEKGCYRMTIKCRGKGSLEFETTQQEYEAHLDFEETGLAAFYNTCKEAGLKCC